MAIIFGRKPVLEALESKQQIDKIYIRTGVSGSEIARISRLAKVQQITIAQSDRKKLDHMTARGKHQGIAALISPVFYVALEDLVDKIQKTGAVPNLLILDKIQDPHNLGAIIRSAEIFGANGVVFSLTDSSPITDVVVKASAGAVFHIPLCKVHNLVSAVRYLKDCGLWIYSSSSQGNKTLWDLKFTNAQAIIIGSEGKGVRRLLVKESDECFRIPQSGKVESLNASVASGIILFEVFRQRHMKEAD